MNAPIWVFRSWSKCNRLGNRLTDFQWHGNAVIATEHFWLFRSVARTIFNIFKFQNSPTIILVSTHFGSHFKLEWLGNFPPIFVDVKENSLYFFKKIFEDDRTSSLGLFRWNEVPQQQKKNRRRKSDTHKLVPTIQFQFSNNTRK